MKAQKLSVMSIILGCSASLSYAQTLPMPVQAEADTLERISVTGSRIQRLEAESTAPVQVFTAADIEQSGVTSVELLLQRMSASAGFAGNQTNAYWNSAGYGTTQVNLRGIGSNRTLVLLNGRRVVNGGSGANSSVDLNMIPLEAIERIEVLKDGASAIYGADAVAGVVNIITRARYDGFAVEARLSATDSLDAKERSFNAIWGISNDRSRIVTTLGYRTSDPLSMSKQAGCAMAEVTQGELSCVGSSSTQAGRATILSGTNAGQRINFTDVQGGIASYEQYDAVKHNFDYFQQLNSVNPVTNWNLATFAELELSETVSLFTEVLYNNRRSKQLASSGSIKNISYAADHPHNPVNETIRLDNRRLVEAGPRDFFQEADTWRFVGGVNGVINNNWQWEISYNYGRNRATDGMTNIANMEHLEHAIDPAQCGQGGIPCVNLLGYGGFDQAAIDYIMFNTLGEGGNEQRSVAANITGDVLDLPAGWLPLAIGIEHRKERGWNTPDAAVSAGISNTNQSDPVAGEYSVDEIYIETTVPLLRNATAAKALNLDLAYRYSDYDTFGSDGNYKLGLNWQLTDNWKLRATRSSAFRVPSIPELFGGMSEGNLTTTDPCSGWDQAGKNATVAANCAAQNIPVGFTQAGTTILTMRGGNLQLEPENANTLTAGIVLDVPVADSLQLTLDYYRIDITNAIQSIAGSTKLAACYQSQNLSHPFCSATHFTRDSLTGEINYLSAQPANAATEELTGVDAAVFYQTTLAGLKTAVNATVSYLDKYQVTPFAGAEAIEYAGYQTGGNGSFPHWRANASISLIDDAWQLHWNMQYIGTADDMNAVAGDLGGRIGSVVYHHLQGAYTLNSWTLTAGINNLFDKEPPFVKSWTDANTDTMTYDLLGRQLFVKARYAY